METNGLESLLSLQGLLGRGQEVPICGVKEEEDLFGRLRAEASPSAY